MQQNEMEALLRNALRQQSGGSDALQQAEQLRSAMNTPQGQQAAQRMMRNHSRSLEQAARMVQAGDMEGAKRSVQNLLRTPEGAQLAAQIAKMMGR